MSEPFQLDSLLGKYVQKPSPNAKPELIALYGRAGSGKTHFAATAGEIEGFKKGLILDTERSSVGVVTDGDFWDVIFVDDHEDPLAYFNALIEAIGDPNMETDYDVIVIDTLDVAQDWAISYYVDGDGCPRSRSGERDTRAGWSKILKWTNNIAQRLKRIEPLVVITVHEREEKSETGALIQRLRLSGGSKDTFASIPDTVIWLERRKRGRDGIVTTAYFGTDDNKVTKDRFGFPPAVQGASLPYLFKLIDERDKE